jgi:hypothetical protein
MARRSSLRSGGLNLARPFKAGIDVNTTIVVASATAENIHSIVADAT